MMQLFTKKIKNKKIKVKMTFPFFLLFAFRAKKQNSRRKGFCTLICT